ncbi:MAG: hypothetical protein ACRDKB_00945 [Actinomycetota bacterium]
MSVRLNRMIYLDGLHRARFETRGACVAGDDRVDVRSRGCETNNTFSTGTLSSAFLGFDARRTAETMPADAPRVETARASAPQQLHTLYVRLRERGDISVQMRARRKPEVDPRPVEGTASGEGKVEGRSVTWHVRDAKPDAYTFSVAFAPNAQPGFAGTFHPEMTVTRAASAGRLLDYFGGSIGAGSSSTRSSVLSLGQLVDPGYGPPGLDVSKAYGARGDGRLPHAWTVATSYRAKGAYQGTVSGHVSETKLFEVNDLAPGSLGLANAGGASYSFSFNGIVGPKVLPTIAFKLTKKRRLAGIEIGIATVGPFDVFGPTMPYPLAGTLWDGDSATFTVGMTLGAMRSSRKGPPANDRGRLAIDWNEGVATGWTVQDENFAPGFEPNGTDTGPSFFHDPHYEMDTAMAVISEGGDIDNRNGDKPVRGAPFRLPVPPGGSGMFVGVGVSAPRQAKYHPKIDFGDSMIIVTPRIMPGGYLLESIGSGYERDWSIHQSVGASVIGPTRDSNYREGRVFFFPEGADNRIYLLNEHGRTRTFEVGGGVWLVERAGPHVTIQRID